MDSGLHLATTAQDLTQRQIVEVYGYPRDKEGKLEVPIDPMRLRKLPQSEEEELNQILPHLSMLENLPDFKVKKEALLKQVKDKWHGQIQTDI